MERWKSALAGVVNQEGKHIFSQVLVVLSILGAFLSAACIDKRTVWRQYGTAYAFTLILDIFLVLAWCWRLTAAFEKSGSFFGQLKRIGSRLEKRQGIFIALVFCCLTRVVQLQDTPKWDALIYYNVLMEACENFDFTFSQYWSSFALAAHPTRGYVSLLAIGEFFIYGTIYRRYADESDIGTFCGCLYVSHFGKNNAQNGLDIHYTSDMLCVFDADVFGDFFLFSARWRIGLFFYLYRLLFPIQKKYSDVFFHRPSGSDERSRDSYPGRACFGNSAVQTVLGKGRDAVAEGNRFFEKPIGTVLYSGKLIGSNLYPDDTENGGLLYGVMGKMKFRNI